MWSTGHQQGRGDSGASQGKKGNDPIFSGSFQGYKRELSTTTEALITRHFPAL